MAIFTSGPAVAEISGSVSGTTFARNRGGAYMRQRAIPVTSTTAYALAAKNRVAVLSNAWAGLTDAQRQAWTIFSQQHPSLNRLGRSITIPPLAYYIRINSRLLAASEAAIDDPPADGPPDPLATLTLAADIGAGDVDLTFTATPLGANDHLWVQACVVSSPTITYIKNYMKLIVVSAAAQASALDIETELTARFGTLQVGQEVHVMVSVFNDLTGLLSGPLHSQATVVST